MKRKETWKQLKLVLVEKNKRKGEYKLDKPTLAIGRAPLNQIVLENKGVSPFHARITVTARTCIISDLGAYEGIQVNGRKTDTKVLHPGDKIRIGSALLLVSKDDPQDKPVPGREKPVRRKKVKLHIPVRLVVVLIIIFLVVLTFALYYLIQLFKQLQ